MARIAVLHPSLTIRMDLKQVLESAGHQVILCSSVQNVHELEHTTPEAVLLDLASWEDDEARVLREGPGRPPIGVVILGAGQQATASRQQVLFCPLPYDESEVLRFVEQALRRARGTKATLLAVDDSPTYLQGLAEQLSEDNYDVLLASSGEEALNLLGKAPVDGILLDLIMAGLSGEETCRCIKARPALRSVPVIMLTAREDREAMVGSFAAGADDFVSKSSDASVLKARLAAQLRRRQNEEELRSVREELHRRALDTAEAEANRKLAETRAALLEDLQRKHHELERREEELRVANTLAQEANAAKDQFLAVLSHELRTPLTPVLAAIQLMQRKHDLPEEERHRLEIIRRNLELEARLIDDLLDLTRIVRGKIVLERKPLELIHVVERVVDICTPDMEARKLYFGLKTDGAPYLVSGDASRLQQVFWNLLKNSIKFTPEGGCVGIECRRQDGRVIVQVTDSGIGIEPEAKTRIFNAFEQGDRRVTRQFGGLGLGLAISKRLVEMHEGTISVQSEGKDKGATFEVALPVVEGVAVEAPAEEKDVAARPRRVKRILLVEDHGDTAEMIRMLLEVSGYEVQTAGDVRQALEATNADGFDLLISDLGLPDQTGLELMKQLRQRGNEIRGIALSGFGREEDVKKSMEAGFSDHLTKPVDVDLLIAAVEQLF